MLCVLIEYYPAVAQRPIFTKLRKKKQKTKFQPTLHDPIQQQQLNCTLMCTGRTKTLLQARLNGIESRHII